MERVVGTLVVADPAKVSDKPAVVVRVRLACCQAQSLVPERNVAVRNNENATSKSISHCLPCAKTLDLSGIEVLDGMVEAVAMNVADVVPFALLELALEPLNESLRGCGRVDEIIVRDVAGVSTVGEEIGGEEEEEGGVDDANSANQRIARLACSRGNTYNTREGQRRFSPGRGCDSPAFATMEVMNNF